MIPFEPLKILLAKQNVTTRIVSPALSSLLVSILMTGAVSGPVRAKTTGRVVQQQATGDRNQRPNIEKDDSEPASTDSRPKRAPKVAARRKKKPAASHLPDDYEMTFISSAPEADVFLDGSKLGTTDQDGKLKTRITPGRHIIKATRSEFGQVVEPIDVGPGLHEIHLSLAPVPAHASESIQPTAPALKEPPRIDPETLTGPVVALAQNDSATEADWYGLLIRSQQALDQHPDSSRAKYCVLVAKGQIAYRRGDFSLALVAFNEAATAQPDLEPAYYSAGNVYARSGLLAEAVTSYRRAIRALPNSAAAHRALGDALSRQGDYPYALAEYQRARQLGYSGADIVLASAQGLMQEPKWREALGAVKPNIGQNASADLLLAIGDCYAALKLKVGAALAYDRAILVDPKSAMAYYKLGLTLFGEHEYVEAKEMFDRAIALDPGGTQIDLSDTNKKAAACSAKAGK
ncbi:MAG TPA: tetratricopeptide repeat protein [Blastocatellia bacterium]|nr:tetratricopeptide repeat protein [Blastocatellia bacterium]